jgi:hypothetical protein
MLEASQNVNLILASGRLFLDFEPEARHGAKASPERCRVLTPDGSPLFEVGLKQFQFSQSSGRFWEMCPVSIGNRIF